MQKITVLCVGKLKEKFYQEAAAEYAKRLGRHCKLEIIELPESRLPEDPSAAEIQRALAAEAAAIRERLPRGGAVIALCIEGKPCSSVELSRRMQELAVSGKSQLTFLIGGSVGLSEDLKRQADWRLSMSPMTFPHHLARIMLLEQIYRACQIAAGTKYHNKTFISGGIAYGQFQVGLCAGCAGVARQCQGREGEGGSADQHLRFHRRCGYAHLASGGLSHPLLQVF